MPRLKLGLPLAAVICCAAGVLLAGGDIVLRPPCPANYTRLIDFSVIALVFEVVLLAGALGLAFASGRRTGVALSVSATAVGMLALLGLLAEVLYLVVVNGDSCWTF